MRLLMVLRGVLSLTRMQALGDEPRRSARARQSERSLDHFAARWLSLNGDRRVVDRRDLRASDALRSEAPYRVVPPPRMPELQPLAPDPQLQEPLREQATKQATEQATKQVTEQAVNATKKHRCGYCGQRFDTRSSLFRHLRDENPCRKLATAHGMPMESPFKTRDRNLRRTFGDILLGGCIVLHRSRHNGTYHCVIVRNAGGRFGFPKGKVEPSDNTLLEAALRETYEEAGLRQDQLFVFPAWAVAAEAQQPNGQPDDENEEVADDDDDAIDDDLVNDDDELDDDDAIESIDPVEAQADAPRFSSEKAFVDVREVTGRQGKRARYFVCAIVTPPPAGHAPDFTPPESPHDVRLSSANDLDGDIDIVEWLDIPTAMSMVASKRRTALNRAVRTYDAYFNAAHQQESAPDAVVVKHDSPPP